MAIDRRRSSSSYLPLRDAIDRLFETSFITPQAFVGSGGFPSADIFTTDDEVVVEMAIPGANPDDINVSVTGDTVTIGGEVRHSWHGPPSGSQQSSSSRQSQSSQQGSSPQSQTYFEEIFRGRFQRMFTLPTQVDANKAEATFDNGILTLKLPKSEATKPRKIQVKQQSTLQGRSSGSSQGSVETEKVPVQSKSS